MKKLLLILYIGMGCFFGFAQKKPIVSADTVMVTGRIMLIDSLCNLQNMPGKHFYSDYKPYYLLLFKPTASASAKTEDRYVIRARSINGLRPDGENSLKLRRLHLKNPNADNQDTSSDASQEILDCHDYVLREKKFTIYELVE